MRLIFYFQLQKGLLYQFIQKKLGGMNKGKNINKNHKRLIIEREGRDIQDKKLPQIVKSSGKMIFPVLDENLAPHGHARQGTKTEGQMANHIRRKSIFSIQRSEIPNGGKPLQSLEKQQMFVRPQVRRMKSCYYSPPQQNGLTSRLNSCEIRQKSKKTQLLMKSLFQLLRSNDWLSQGKSESLSMKYDHFSSFILCIMMEMSLKQSYQKQKEVLVDFDNIICELKESLDQQEGKRHRKSLKIDSKLSIFQYSSQKFQRQSDSFRIDISKLSKDRQDLLCAIAKLNSTASTLSIQCNLKQEILTKLQKEIYSLSSNKANTEEEYIKVSGLLRESQSRYSSMVEQQQKILNYVMKQQNNKIIKLVSEDYKQIQADIYEYASYLQANELASNLDYQPRPFDLIEKELMEEMKEVNKFILKQDTSSIPQKQKVMRDFILKVVDKFKKKDSQMGRLCDFKTKCIKKFVNQMKKWLNNWQLKQQYLVNLRKQFALDSLALKNKLDELCVSQSGASCCTGRDFEQVREIETIFHKIQENYKLGNSFY